MEITNDKHLSREGKYPKEGAQRTDTRNTERMIESTQGSIDYEEIHHSGMSSNLGTIENIGDLPRMTKCKEKTGMWDGLNWKENIRIVLGDLTNQKENRLSRKRNLELDQNKNNRMIKKQRGELKAEVMVDN